MDQINKESKNTSADTPAEHKASPGSSGGAASYNWMLDEYIGNVYVSDMDTYELLYINPTSSETLGLPPEKVLGRKCYEIIQGRSSPCPFCTNKCLSEDKFYEWEYYNPYLERAYILKDRIIDWNGRKVRLELSHDNLSTEYKLEKREREREAILRTIPGGFARLDARDMRTVIWYGGGFLPLIGYTKEQFENELHSQCNYVHPEDMARATQIMELSRETGQDTFGEGRIITRNGTVKILTMTYSFVSGENSWDGLDSFYSIGIDVTKEREEQERQRRALEDAYLSAKVANSAKTNFLSSMSHNIRTPMNAIIGMTLIAKENVHAPEKIRDCLNKIDTSSRHLLGLINEVLDMSKIESGKINLSLSTVNLPELVQSISDICRPLVTEKQQQFQVIIGHVRHENVIADGDRLQQILMNLLSNSIKYTPENGTITLKINEQYSSFSGKSQYEFICMDTGIGIPKDFIPYIFEPFTRAEDPRISKLQGTGLGMTITQNIIRLMNGTIHVDSTPGAGSTFTASIPLEFSPDQASVSRELIGRPVLIVHEDPAVCNNAALLLNELGMRGSAVFSLEEALRRMRKAHEEKDDFFAVIVDYMILQTDNGQAFRAMRGSLGKFMPILIIAAYDYSDIETAYTNAEADAFVVKPLFKSKMIQVLNLFTAAHSENEDTGNPKRPLDLTGKRVLLAEDNDINREIATELLQMQGIVVDAVENGLLAKEAFAAAAPGTYNAILLDIQMPVMDGYDAAKSIRALKRSDARAIPIIALTANAFTADAAKARSVGMNDHIAKPIDINRFIEVLQKWMNEG